ncbi:MAG: hypothetical protein OQK82_04180, partial [Candidatus Pacearchaeota archaeon]|nr:hypothetical protein [Candidatus Pacearchaeota archaeon]
NHKFEMEKRLYNLGQRVRLVTRTPEKVLVEGLLHGVDDDGAALVLPYGEEYPARVIAGEMFFVDD